MKQRALICLLTACILAAYAFERLPFNETGIQQIFAYSWIGFCALVVGGNGIALITQAKKARYKALGHDANQEKNQRQFG